MTNPVGIVRIVFDVTMNTHGSIGVYTCENGQCEVIAVDGKEFGLKLTIPDTPKNRKRLRGGEIVMGWADQIAEQAAERDAIKQAQPIEGKPPPQPRRTNER